MSDKRKNLMLKIFNQSQEIYKLKEAKTLTSNDINEYKENIREIYKIFKDNNILKDYDYFLDFHNENFYNYQKEMAMTTSDINFLNELMNDKNFFEIGSIAKNPNATPEILREISEKYGHAMAIIENPNTPINVLEKYCLDKDDTEVYESAIKKLEEREKNNIKDI